VWSHFKDCRRKESYGYSDDELLNDIENCWILLSSCVEGKGYFCRSLLPKELTDSILDTRLPEKFAISSYNCELDGEDTSIAKTYHDIYQYYGSMHLVIFTDETLPELDRWKPSKEFDRLLLIPHIYQYKRHDSSKNGSFGNINLRYHNINLCFSRV
jgi:hypothetical protein